jgi:hypothetical protein
MVTGVIQRTPSDLDTITKSELLEWAERNGLSQNNTIAFELGKLYVSGMRSLVQFCAEKGIDQDRLNAALDERESIAIQDAKAQRNTTLEYLNQKEGTKTLHAEEGKKEEKISLEEKFRKDQIVAQSSSIASLYQQIFTIQQNSMDFYFEARPSRSSTPALYQMRRLVDEIVSNYRRSSGISSSSSSSGATTLFQQKIIAFLEKEKLEKKETGSEKKEIGKENKQGNENKGKKGKSVLEVSKVLNPEDQAVQEAVRIFRASKKYIIDAFTKIKTKLREFYVEYTVTQKERVFCDLSSFESFKERISQYSSFTLSSRFGFSPTYNVQSQIDAL